MPNHYHLLLQTPRANLSAAVAWFQTTYRVRFNRRHRRSGHLYQGRFKAHLVDADGYAQQLLKYIHLNPVRPRDKRASLPGARRTELDAYRWSSHQAYAGRVGRPVPGWLCLEWLSYFGDTPQVAQKEYLRQIDEMFGQVVSSPWEVLRRGLVLGGETLWNRVAEHLDQAEGDPEIRWRRRGDADEVSRWIGVLVAREADRRVAIWLRVRLGGQRMTDLAKEYGYRDGSGIHRVVKRLEAAANHDQDLSRRLRQLAADVSSVKG